MKVALTVNDFLRRAEQAYPDRVGVIDEPDQPAANWGSITYREMARRARAQAAGLDALGIAQGERVAMVSHNSARLLTAFYGVSGSGRVLVPINFRLVAEEIQYIVDHSGARLLLVDPELASALQGIRCERMLMIGDDTDAELSRFDTEPARWEPDEDATATINYTSGTTARPKGVQLTHRNLWVNATTFGWHLGVNDRDVYLHTLPQFHCNGWGMTYATTGMGAQHIILRKIDGNEILRRVQRHGVTLMCAAPAVLNAVLDAAQTWEGEIPGRGTVRLVAAGAPPPTRTIERIETELGWEFNQIYGLTETSPLLTINRSRVEYDDLTAAERAQLLSRAGAPAIGIETAISATGEVLARGNVVMAGYWQQPTETAAAVYADVPTGATTALEWFHTGDGGFIDDADHYLTISDRKKDVIISGGENVSSIEVEDAVFSHPEVEEVAVIGVPDEKWGELVMALVVRSAGSALTEADLIAYTRTKLAAYKCPKRVEFRDSLARTATGKLQKFKLREPFWAGQAKGVN
ncbi:MAG: putative fatty-acid--CoA ligase [Ilumatobacteraceae bacterium]|nr:putative fatty-acid--CoA ligase [Ilumatobacteraceae bacterium]